MDHGYGRIKWRPIQYREFDCTRDDRPIGDSRKWERWHWHYLPGLASLRPRQWTFLGQRVAGKFDSYWHAQCHGTLHAWVCFHDTNWFNWLSVFCNNRW